MLSFSDFAQAVRDFLSSDLSNGEYVKQLLGHIVYFDNPDMDPVPPAKDDTLYRYYSGAPFQAFAKRIKNHLNEGMFSEFVESVEPTIQEEARQKLAPYLSDTDLNSFPEACSKLFADVIRAEANGDAGGAGKIANLQPSLSLSYQLQTAEDRLKDECHMRCLLCGEKLKSYVKTEIIPSASDYKVRNEIKNLLKKKSLDESIPDINNEYDTHAEYNLALLDPNCHTLYERDFSPEKCSQLMTNKIFALRQAAIQEELDGLEVDRSLSELLDSLDKLIDPEAVTALQYSPTTIANKIESERHILKTQVNELVARYYGFIRDSLHAREGVNGFQFIDLQYSVKKYFTTLERAGEDQDEIYSRLAVWIKESTRCKSLVACEILVSYFIQECEVFHEIA